MLIHMTPKQVADRLIAERLTLGDNSKAMKKAAIERSASARRKAEALRDAFDAARVDRTA